MPETEIPKTGPEAILHALSQMNADSIEADAKAALATGKKTHRSKAVQKLRIVEGLRRNKLEPKDYMITKVPVIPTRFRPFAAQGDTLIPGDANILYKDLLDVKAAHDEERKMFGDKNAGTSRLALYDAVKASYGYGDPVKPKTKEKDVQGFLKVIVGRTAKRGFVQSKLMSKTQDNVGRSTIIVDPELSMDEIGIPKAMAFTMYAPYIQRQLKQSGYRDAEALKHVKDQTPEALAALERIVRERPVLYSRAPAWHKFSVNAGNVKLVDEDAISISPAVTTGLGADFDGDTINVHVPASDDAVKEAYEKLMPSKHAFSDRDSSKVVPLPKQEQILGLYTAATAPATKPVVFDTEEDAIRAIRQGKISLSTDVEIRGQQKSAAADKKEEDLVESIKKPGDEKGPVRVPKTGRFMKTVRDHDDVREAVDKNMKEKGKELQADEYAEEYAREYAREVARRSNK